MKQCPACRRAYTDETLSFCLEDGTPLISQAFPAPTQQYIPAPTQEFKVSRGFASVPTNFQFTQPAVETAPKRGGKLWLIPIFAALFLIISGGGILVLLLVKNKNKVSDSNIRPVVSNVSAPNVAFNSNPAASPTVAKLTSQQLVGTWVANVKEEGTKMQITCVFSPNGTSKYFFKAANGQTGKDQGTWQFSDGTLFEKYSNGASGKGAIRRIDDDTFEITIIDNGTPSYNGVKRVYHRQ